MHRIKCIVFLTPIVLSLVWVLVGGCAVHKAKRPPDSVTEAELRPRLARLQKGMLYNEVAQMLKVDLFPGAMSMNWCIYVYPPPFLRRNADGSVEHYDYDLAVAFQGLGTNATLSEATLTSRSGKKEVWPK